MIILNTDCPPARSPTDLPDEWPQKFISPDAARFAARYRVANEFQKVIFTDSIKPPTADGYSRLIHFFFTYSAWEQFQAAFGKAEVVKLIEKYPYPELKVFIEHQCNVPKIIDQQSGEPRDSLFDHLIRKASTKLRGKLSEMIAGKPFEICDLAFATRNAFFHGELTPNASGGGVGELVSLLTGYFLAVMRKEAGALANRSLNEANCSRSHGTRA